MDLLFQRLCKEEELEKKRKEQHEGKVWYSSCQRKTAFQEGERVIGRLESGQVR